MVFRMKTGIQRSVWYVHVAQHSRHGARYVSTASTARQYALDASNRWLGVETNGGPVCNYYDGKFHPSTAKKTFDVVDPATQEIVGKVPQSTAEELDLIIGNAEAAFPTWHEMGIMARQQIMFKFSSLLRQHQDDIAHTITLEQGKTLADARGDVLRGLQVAETCTAGTTTLMGQRLHVAKGMDTWSAREPLGVTASINPFNFPAMCPLWSIPTALIAGNTHIVKPSEKVPGAAQMIVELATRAGVPNGVLNIAHGGHDTVNALCTDARVKALSFVGSDQGGKHVYELGTSHGKRVQSNLGAKNHAILLPDADKEAALASIVGAAFGAAGQRCMALSVIVVVGEARNWMQDLIERASKLRVGSGFDATSEVGPLITLEARERVLRCIDEASNVILDGRKNVPEGTEGNFIGPTLIEGEPGMAAYDTELFGPVLTVVYRDTLNDALVTVNQNRYGNGASIFTRNGASARFFEERCQAGQIGINVPIPVPLPMFSWSGGKASALGDLGFYGEDGLRFFTKKKTVTSLWRRRPSAESSAQPSPSPVSMPTFG